MKTCKTSSQTRLITFRFVQLIFFNENKRKLNLFEMGFCKFNYLLYPFHIYNSTLDKYHIITLNYKEEL